MDSPKGTVVFTTVGRQAYGFDVFSVKVPSDLDNPKYEETRLTDGISLNFDAQFTEDDESVVHVSERHNFTAIYLSKSGISPPKQLPYVPESVFHDRPIIKNNRLYFISAHEKPDKLMKSWNALYVTDLEGKNITRLTPPGHVDYSPAVSLSGKYIAVSSFGSRLWDVVFYQLNTDIVIFEESNPNKRAVVCGPGGWPSWSGDSTLYFHRKCDDGIWSIFQVKVPENLDGFSCNPVRITPPDFHCITPAAMHDGKRIVVATRRPGGLHRHIEIFDLATKTFTRVTESINPKYNHYNPFVSSDSSRIGYHRFRGESADGEKTVPNLEPVRSVVKEIRMLRINGSFPSFSPPGDYLAFNAGLSQGLHIVKADGSKRWTLLPRDRVSFYTCWSPKENVIYTTLGPVFAPPHGKVQIARISFDPSHLTPDRSEIPCEVKMLTGEESGNNAFPACSPDGKSIVFRSGRSGHKNLYIMDAVEGEFKGNIRQLTTGECTDTMPSWSPKGDLIAFSSNRHNPGHDNPFSIYVVKPDGSDLRRIHLEGSEKLSEEEKSWMERINHVTFSPCGEWIFFTGNIGSLTAEPVSVPRQIQPYGDIYMARLDGTGLRRLSWNGYENGTPAFHPGHELHSHPERAFQAHTRAALLSHPLEAHTRAALLSHQLEAHTRALTTISLNLHQPAEHNLFTTLDGEKLAGEFNDVTWLKL